MSGGIVVREDNLRLDHVAREVYGAERGGGVEAMLAANRGLGALPALLPVGTEIATPILPAPVTRATPTANPWD